MIGIICNKNERAVVEEFFELFKTPWQFFTESESYDVILSTRDITTDINAKLLVYCNSNVMRFDRMEGLNTNSNFRNVIIQYKSLEVPIYGKISTFRDFGEPLIRIKCNKKIAGLEIKRTKVTIIRIGYDYFQEVSHLLSKGQPIQNAMIPTLEIHISMLRDWILKAGITVIEIPPVPLGNNFIACLTHDVDFLGIRRHKLDHTMWGFLHRASIGSLSRFLKRKICITRLIHNLKAIVSLPIVYAGFYKDFWLTFERYLEIEKNLKSTFFIIPFKNTPGEKVTSNYPKRRATEYDITDMQEIAQKLIELDFEIGVHGIDAWHNSQKGYQELNRISSVTGKSNIGIRMHWLCFDERSPEILDKSGFCYDSSFGYNDTIGFRAGTAQVFRPLGVNNLLELPLHIQDRALLDHGRMNLEENEAGSLCEELFDNISKYGGVITILWHLRSLAPERLWENFYINIIKELKARNAWFATASQVVGWFRQRRNLEFEYAYIAGNRLRSKLRYSGNKSDLKFNIRIHMPDSLKDPSYHLYKKYIDIPLTVDNEIKVTLDEKKSERHFGGKGF